MAEETKIIDDASSPELIAAALNNYAKKANALFAGTATKQELKQLQAELIVEGNELKSLVTQQGTAFDEAKKELVKLQEAVVKQGEVIATLKTLTPAGSGKRSLYDAVLEQIQKGVFTDFIEKKASQAGFRLDLKDVAFTGTYGSGAAQQAFMPFTVPQYPVLEDFDVRLIVPTGTIDSEKLEYPQERAASLTDATATKAENADLAESTFGFTMATANSKRVGAFVEVSRRAMRNSTWLANYISNRLMALFIKKLNTLVIAGAGTGTDLSGLVTNANSFTGTNFAGKIDGANYMDVLNCAKGEMLSGYFINPTSILLNPIDYTILTSVKNTIADFINPATFLSSNQAGYQGIFGMRPIQTADIVAGTYLAAALNPAYMQLLFNGPIEISSTDSHGTNFIANLTAIKLEADVMLPIYNANALIAGTFDTDLTTITKV